MSYRGERKVTGLQVAVHENQRRTEYGKNSLITALIMIGCANLCKDTFPSIRTYWWVYAVLGSLVCVGFLQLYERWEQTYIFVIGVGIVCVGLGVSFFLLKDGMLSLANDVLIFLTGKTGRIYLNYPVEHENYAYITMAWLDFLLALWIAKAIQFREKAVITALMILMMMAATIGFVEAGMGFLLVLMAVALFLFPERGMFPVWACAISFAVCVGCFFLYEDFSSIEVAKSVKEQMHERKYESKKGAMPEGDLSDLGAFDKENSVALEIQMEHPQKLYLRGMVGEIYTGTGWETLKGETYVAAEDTFYWLHKKGFYGQSTIGNAVSLTEDAKKYEMTICNISACRKYQYLPYALAENDVLDSEIVGDSGVYAENIENRETGISYYAGSVPEWYQAKIYLVNDQEKTEISNYLKQEQTYREFVYEQDLQLTNEVVGVCQRMLGDSKESMNLSKIMTLVRDTLEDKLEYSEQVVTLNGTNDFMQYTLEQSKKGYSVHYATLATLMLRYCGVPARYVEGYFLSADEAARYEKGDIILLEEAHAHAWTEYYLNGVGWIPFEVTPGYIDEEEIAAMQGLALESENPEQVGHSYQKSSITYRPPLENKKDEQNKDHAKFFGLTWQMVFKILIVLLLVVFIAFVYRIVKRYRKLKDTLLSMQQADNRTAIAMQYSYAKLLQQYAGVENKERQQENSHQKRMRELNQEAMFSSHEMSKEQRMRMEAYTKEVLFVCKNQWSAWQQFCYHYILWLYS